MNLQVIAGLVTLADKGYQGSTYAKIRYKGKNKPDSQKQANKARAKLRAPGTAVPATPSAAWSSTQVCQPRSPRAAGPRASAYAARDDARSETVIVCTCQWPASLRTSVSSVTSTTRPSSSVSNMTWRACPAPAATFLPVGRQPRKPLEAASPCAF